MHTHKHTHTRRVPPQQVHIGTTAPRRSAGCRLARRPPYPAADVGDAEGGADKGGKVNSAQGQQRTLVLRSRRAPASRLAQASVCLDADRAVVSPTWRRTGTGRRRQQVHEHHADVVGRDRQQRPLVCRAPPAQQPAQVHTDRERERESARTRAHTHTHTGTHTRTDRWTYLQPPRSTGTGWPARSPRCSPETFPASPISPSPQRSDVCVRVCVCACRGRLMEEEDGLLLLALPDELWTRVFALLDAATLVRAGAVCSTWRRISADPSLCMDVHMCVVRSVC
jgi:hypothetical protein